MSESIRCSSDQRLVMGLELGQLRNLARGKKRDLRLDISSVAFHCHILLGDSRISYEYADRVGVLSLVGVTDR